MKLREFKAVLSSLGAALNGDEARLVSALSASLPSWDGTVAALLNAARGAAPEASRTTQGPFIADALPILQRAATLVRTIAKQMIVNDYELLLEWAERRPRLPITALTQLAPTPAAGEGQTDVREHVVREYTEMLRSARSGSQAYGDALDKLAGDKKRVRKQEMVAIARSVVDATLAASTTKTVAFKRIRRPHDAYLDSAARSDAISGARPPRHT
jgi:hypothetical protein